MTVKGVTHRYTVTGITVAGKAIILISIFILLDRHFDKSSPD